MTKEEREKKTPGTEEDSGAPEARPAEVPEEGAGAASAGKEAELMEKELAELRKKAEERDEYMNLLLRARADFQNYQKRMKKEMDALNRLAVQDVMLALLPIVDNLSRAVKSVGKDNSQALEKFIHGVKLIQGQFLKVLESFGVKPIHGQEGQAFDPELHEAVMEEENDEFPHHTVLEEVEQGFFLGDRVLRPVKVKVSRKPAAGTGEGAEKEREGRGPEVQDREGDSKKTSGMSPEGSQDMDTGPAGCDEEPVV